MRALRNRIDGGGCDDNSDVKQTLKTIIEFRGY